MAILHVASLASAGVEPNLLREPTHQIEANPDGVGTAHSSDAVEIGLHAIGQRHVDHKRDFFHVDPARRHVRTNQNTRHTFFESLQRMPNTLYSYRQRGFALLRLAKPRQHHRVVLVRSSFHVSPVVYRWSRARR